MDKKPMGSRLRLLASAVFVAISVAASVIV
jgi:hypothetical protein